MSVFGQQWEQHHDKIRRHWLEKIHEDDLVLLAGDISWAMRPEQAIPDLQWIADLPGTKVMIRGNHDYWWPSLKKLKEILPPSIHAIHNTVFNWNDISIAGTRLWDSPEYDFSHLFPSIDTQKPPLDDSSHGTEEDRSIFRRELQRLELSLKLLNTKASKRIAMTHYPPIGTDLQASDASTLLEKYGVDVCVFGHLHNLPHGITPFGIRGGVHYYLTACDYLDFKPIRIL